MVRLLFLLFDNRTLKCFLSWCNEDGYSDANLKIYKAAETVKETYTDEELLTLLKKPEADCKFCEYRIGSL